MDIPVNADEVVFRCNLVAIRDEKMWSYSSGYITTEEARQLVETLNQKLGDEDTIFYPGVSYRHILKIKRASTALQAKCTPPHDIANQPIDKYLPQGNGSQILGDLMRRSEPLLRDHPVNVARRSRGEIPATSIWLFWGSGQIPRMPSFEHVYGLKSAMTSGVDLLRGLAKMAGMTVLKIPGVTDGLDNDFAGQAKGGLGALRTHDIVVIHVEAPDEAAHEGSVEKKVAAIESIDREIIAQVMAYRDDDLRVLVMPDHPTPIKIQTHNNEPVPFLLWGNGITGNGAKRFTESEARQTGAMVDRGYAVMSMLVVRDKVA
jgi:2,3-bisphosphoglycerate-independent phosphoglycerate mutase